MSCRKFLKGYRGNIVARQYTMARTEQFRELSGRGGSPRDEEVYGDDEGVEVEWVEVAANQVPALGASSLLNLPAPTASGAAGAKPGSAATRSRSVALFNLEGELHAIDSRCPHMGGPLEKGVLLANGSVRCPWHRWCIDVKTGKVGTLGDIEDAAQPTFPVRREGEKVLVCTRPRRPHNRPRRVAAAGGGREQEVGVEVGAEEGGQKVEGASGKSEPKSGDSPRVEDPRRSGA